MKRKLFAMLNLVLVIQLLTTPFLVSGEEVTVSLSFTNLANPGEDHYEGWLIVDGSPISTGKFTIGSDGDITDLDGNDKSDFSVSGVDISKVTKFVLSLEEKGDTDSTPNSIKPLAGDFTDMKATLTHNIGKDFSSIGGKYILATPTNGADTNENSGIWYLSLESGSPAVGLTLPDLTGTDWTYEGWVIFDGVPVTTGTFDKADVADNFDGYSSTEAGPPFPGEDFLTNAPSGLSFPTDIAGMETAITIEPRMDNDPAPFQFHPLMGTIPADATDHVTYSMDDMTSGFATGMVTLSTSGNESSLPGPTFVVTLLSIFSLMIVVRKFRK